MADEIDVTQEMIEAGEGAGHCDAGCDRCMVERYRAMAALDRSRDRLTMTGERQYLRGCSFGIPAEPPVWSEGAVKAAVRVAPPAAFDVYVAARRALDAAWRAQFGERAAEAEDDARTKFREQIAADHEAASLRKVAAGCVPVGNTEHPSAEDDPHGMHRRIGVGAPESWTVRLRLADIEKRLAKLEKGNG